MRIISYLCFILFAIPLHAQNNIVVDPYLDKEILYGKCTVEDFQQAPFAEWYNEEYKNYTLEKDVLARINREELRDIEVTIVLGTWCHDSQREVPRFLKIMKSLNVDEEMMRIYCVNRKKEAEGIPVKDLEVEFVPTFIFYRNDQEIGRIVETPKTFLEKDIVNIITFE